MIDDDDTKAATVIGPREFVILLYRRRWWLAMPMLAGLLAAVVVMMLVKPSYTSSATLLIASQQIAAGLVPAPDGNYADERIAKIRQQITSRDTLAGIIATMGLYRGARRAMPMDAMIGTMRRDIGVDLVGTNAGTTAGAGHPPTGNTIAFKLSFAYADPDVARTVTSRLTTMFLSADKRLRTEQAAGTAAFLGRRADELRAQLVDMAGKRRAIEARYAGALPNQVAISAQSGATLRAEVSRIDAEQQGLMQQNSLLAARGQEIAAIPPQGIDGVRRAEEKLNLLSGVYSDTFPDVIAARDAVARQRATLRSDAIPAPGGGAIAAEVAAGRSRIDMLAGRRAGLVQSISGMERTTSLAPQASYELNNLERDYDSLRAQYQGIRDKQMDAQVTANLQTEDKGERFSVVDVPSLPLEATGFGKKEILAIGLLGGLAIGFALVVVFEFVNGAIHGESGVIRYMGAPPLVVVSYLKHGNRTGILAAFRHPFAGRKVA